MLGARVRPGDTSLGEADVEDVEQWLDRTREAAGRHAVITVRIDAGGDCAALLAAVVNRKALFVVKAKQTANLLGALMQMTSWHTVDSTLMACLRVKPPSSIFNARILRSGGRWMLRRAHSPMLN